MDTFWFPRPIPEILKDCEQHGLNVPEALRQKLHEVETTKKPLVYLAGPMRLRRVYDSWWRDKYAPKLAAMGYMVLNTVVIECELYGAEFLAFQEQQKNLIARGRYRTFGDLFMPVLELDMALVHQLARNKMSCLVAYFPTDVVKSGTDIECFEAFRLGVATFILQEGPSTAVRPFLQAPWTRMYAQKKFQRFKTWKSLLAHLKERISEGDE